jgi:spermidine synthase
MVLTRPRSRVATAVGVCAALLLAVGLESGVGRERVQGWGLADARILAYAEGPDSTVAVVESTRDRFLVIDGFQASGSYQAGSAHYMEWMGRLPMLLHPEPEDALVICLGTGQTVNGVRREGVERLDVVDVSDAVVRMAPLFVVNEGVLDDPRVRTVVMDGRAWLRRNDRRYDVVTLEPMPPGFAGVNALYSREFYEQVSLRLEAGGIAVQWLPIHTLPPRYSASVAATFREAFPDAVLWVDPVAPTGILLGRKETADEPLGTRWPGLDREAEGRDLTPLAIRRALLLYPPQLERYAAGGRVITDDNQMISYGRMRSEQTRSAAQNVAANLRAIRAAARAAPRRSVDRGP